MNGQREDNPYSCHFHPDVAFVGVCPICLNERLIVLAAKQSYHRRWISSQAHKAHSHHQSRIARSKNAGINIPKIFVIGSLLNRLEFRYRRNDSPNAASSRPEDDSFISIKFADNGVASWEKNPESKISHDNCNIPWIRGDSIGNAATFKDAEGAATATTKSVIEHSKPEVASLRWQKRIGHLFHLVRWKRSSKAGSFCHLGSKVEGMKKRTGWVRTLTSRRTKG